MADLIEAGLTVTVIGMSVVFVLLTLLVLIVNSMSRLSRWIEGPAPPVPHRPGGASAGADDEATLVSVVSAAIATFRRRRRDT